MSAGHRREAERYIAHAKTAGILSADAAASLAVAHAALAILDALTGGDA